MDDVQPAVSAGDRPPVSDLDREADTDPAPGWMARLPVSGRARRHRLLPAVALRLRSPRLVHELFPRWSGETTGRDGHGDDHIRSGRASTTCTAKIPCTHTGGWTCRPAPMTHRCMP